MYAVERLSRYISHGVYTVSGPFHPFGGAVDIIVVQQEDGSFKSSPWYVRFGKFQGVLKTKEKIVNISVNGAEAGFHMYLDHKGEAHFLNEILDGEEGDFTVCATSSGEENDESGRFRKSQSLNIDNKEPDLVKQIGSGGGKPFTRTSSKRSRILGFVFGKNSMKEDTKHMIEGHNVERVSSLERAEIAADLLEVKWSTNLKTGRLWNDSNETKLSDPSQLEKEVHKGPIELIRVVNEDKEMEVRLEVCEEGQFDGILGGNGAGSNLLSGNDGGNGAMSDLHRTIHSESDAEKEVDLKSENSVKITSSQSRTVDQVLDRLELAECHSLDTGEKCLVKQAQEYSIVNLDSNGESRGENGGHSSHLCFGRTESTSLEKEDSDKLSLINPPCCHNEVEICTKILFSEISTLPGAEVQHLEEENTGFSENTEVSTSNHFETETVQVIQTSEVIGLMPEKASERDSLENVGSQPQFQVTRFSPIQLVTDDSEVVHMNTSTLVEKILVSTDEPQQKSIFTISSTTRDEIHGKDEAREVGVDDQVSSDMIINHCEPYASNLSKELENPLVSLMNSEDEHFLIDDLDNVGISTVDQNAMEGIDVVEDGSCDRNQNSPFSSSHQSFESPLSRASAVYPGELIQHAFSQACSPEEKRTGGTPIYIPRSRAFTREHTEFGGSLPNMSDRIHDGKRSDIHKPLSRSLDSTFDMPKWVNLGEGLPGSLKLSASEGNLASVQPAAESVSAIDGTQHLLEEAMPTNHPVEISLCRHLLFEGMGDEAASHAFDSEKLDVEKFTSLGPSIVKNDRLVVRINGCYFPWESAGPIILGLVSFGQANKFEVKGSIAVEKRERGHGGGNVPSRGSWRLWPFNFGKSKSRSSVYSPSDSTKEIDSQSVVTAGESCTSEAQSKRTSVRSLVPTSDQLASLNLKEGRNAVTFTFFTGMLGRQQVDARIYLWKWNTRIVVSDVDGTITKSDVLGQFMPLVGKDWSQTGVAHLFSAIKENGYQLLFLSARAIAQAYLTRQFLFNLKQDGKVLPDGPVVISPDGLFPSLYREVIRRAPHEFKIACLEDIRALFPPDCNPFYAGFGNRDTDEISYLKVGIPKGKIFIINPKGEVAVNRRVDTKSYTSLHALVHGMFPAMPSAEQEDFNSWNYWRMPLPDISL